MRASKLLFIIVAILNYFSYSALAEEHGNSKLYESLDENHPDSFEGSYFEIGDAMALSVPAEPIDCSVRRTLHVRLFEVESDGNGNLLGNYRSTRGAACGTGRHTLRVPNRRGCPWRYIVTPCSNGIMVGVGEFGISEAHSKVIPVNYTDSCGAGGKDVRIVNRDVNRKIRVSLEVSSASIQTINTDIDFDPGEDRVVGCSNVGGDERNYKIVTARFLP